MFPFDIGDQSTYGLIDTHLQRDVTRQCMLPMTNHTILQWRDDELANWFRGEGRGYGPRGPLL